VRSALRILHLADSHLGAGLPRRARVRRRTRGDDLIDSYRRGLARASEFGVDLVIHAGDVFDAPHPTGSALAAAAEPLLESAGRGIPVVIVPGNHERSVLPGSVLLAHPLIHVVAEPTTLCFECRGWRVAVAAFPCVRRRSGERFAEFLAATGWEDVPADVRILAVHQTFADARCGPDNFRFRVGEDVIAREAVPAAFHYVAAGHVHRHQALATTPDGPPIVYAGSLDRVSFAERDEPKGCVLVEFSGRGGVEVRYLEHPVRPMVTRSIDVTGLSPADVASAIVVTLAGLPQAAVASVQLTGRSEPQVLRGLRLTRLAREARPDADVTISARGVEYDRSRGGRAVGPVEPPELGASVTSCHFRIEEAANLPRGPGAYRLYDAAGRLLYVGKANNLRQRVATHLRSGRSTADGWTARIAAIRTLGVPDELAAELLEAHLIARLRPPQNRRMRTWRQYVYIAAGEAFGQLEVVERPAPRQTLFGPYRSRFHAAQIIECVSARFGLALCPPEEATALPLLPASPAARLCDRYFARQCAGPCAGRVTADEYALRQRQAADLLTGRRDAIVVEQEALVLAGEAAGRDDDAFRAFRRATETLRAAFAHGAMVAGGEQLVGSLLVWRAGPPHLAALFERTRMRLFTMPRSEEGLARVIGACRRAGEVAATSRIGRLSCAVLDAYTLTARRLQQSAVGVRHFSREELRHLDAAALAEELATATASEKIADCSVVRR
jgi:exonuclease SbcD